MYLIRAFQKCLELWSSAEDDIRIAAYLSVRRLALSNDDSILDSILKVGTHEFSYSMPQALTSISEYVPLLNSVIKKYKCPYLTFYQLDEEFRIGSILYRSFNSVPACFWLYPPARYSFTEQHEDQIESMNLKTITPLSADLSNMAPYIFF